MDGTATWTGTNTSANYSPSIWNDCPVESLRDGQATGPGGFIWEHRFVNIPVTLPTTEGNWGELTAFSSTGGTAVPDDGEIGGGVALASDDDNEGVGMRSGGTPAKIILTGGDFWFEARVKSSTIADTKLGFFLGLTANVALTATSPIAANGTLADINLVGFHRLEGDGDKVDAVYKASGVTQVTVQADAGTLVAATYTNLGMKFVAARNIGRGVGYLYWFQDGVEIAAKLIPSAAGTDFPNNVNLGFVFAMLNAAAAPGTASIKHVRMAQVIR